MPEKRRPSQMSEDELSRAIGTGKYAKGKSTPDAETPSNREPNRANWRERLKGAARYAADKVSRANAVVQERHRDNPALGRGPRRRSSPRRQDNGSSFGYYDPMMRVSDFLPPGFGQNPLGSGPEPAPAPRRKKTKKQRRYAEPARERRTESAQDFIDRLNGVPW